MAKEVESVIGATGSSQNPAGKSTKPAGMSNEDSEKLDITATSTIQLCLTEEVMYNVMDEETGTGL